MSVRDQRRILQALFTLTRRERAAGATYGEINVQLGRAEDDIRVQLGMAPLVESEFVVLHEGRAVLTAAGAEAIGE